MIYAFILAFCILATCYWVDFASAWLLRFSRTPPVRTTTRSLSRRNTRWSAWRSSSAPVISWSTWSARSSSSSFRWLCPCCVSNFLLPGFYGRSFVLVVFVHASFRLRSISNKLANKIEAAGFKQTIMGRLLDILGLKVELVSFD